MKKILKTLFLISSLFLMIFYIYSYNNEKSNLNELDNNILLSGEVNGVVTIDSTWKNSVSSAYSTYTEISFVTSLDGEQTTSATLDNGVSINTLNSDTTKAYFIYDGTISVTGDASSLFEGCNALQVLDLSNLDMSKVTTAPVISSLTNLTKVITPSTLNVNMTLPTINGNTWIDTSDNAYTSIGGGTTVVLAQIVNVPSTLTRNSSDVTITPTDTSKDSFNIPTSSLSDDTSKTNVSPTCSAVGYNYYTYQKGTNIYSITETLDTISTAHNYTGVLDGTWLDDSGHITITLTCSHEASHTKTITTLTRLDLGNPTVSSNHLTNTYTRTLTIDDIEYSDVKITETKSTLTDDVVNPNGKSITLYNYVTQVANAYKYTGSSISPFEYGILRGYWYTGDNNVQKTAAIYTTTVTPCAGYNWGSENKNTTQSFNIVWRIINETEFNNSLTITSYGTRPDSSTIYSEDTIGVKGLLNNRNLYSVVVLDAITGYASIKRSDDSSIDGYTFKSSNESVVMTDSYGNLYAGSTTTVFGTMATITVTSSDGNSWTFKVKVQTHEKYTSATDSTFKVNSASLSAINVETYTTKQSFGRIYQTSSSDTLENGNGVISFLHSTLKIGDTITLTSTASLSSVYVTYNYNYKDKTYKKLGEYSLTDNALSFTIPYKYIENITFASVGSSGELYTITILNLTQPTYVSKWDGSTSETLYEYVSGIADGTYTYTSNEFAPFASAISNSYISNTSGDIKATNAGSYNATFSLGTNYAWDLDTNGDYVMENKTFSWNVLKADQTISVNDITLTTNSTTITPTNTGDSTTFYLSENFSYSLKSTTSVVSLSGNTLTLGTTNGSAVVIVSNSGDDNLNSYSKEITVSVSLHNLTTATYIKNNDTTVTVNASCDCGNTHTKTFTNAEWENSITSKTEPTCTTSGTYTHKVTIDGMDVTLSEDVDATGHSYGSWELVTAPTTSTKGSLKKTCSRCSDEVTFELPVLNSTDYTYSVTTAATCTQTGVGKYSYTKDTQTFDFNVTLESLGHSYGSWELVTAPTTSTKGSLKKTCSRCSDEVTFELPVLNSTDYTYSVTTAATCTQTGVGKYSYTKDTQTFDFNVTLESLGHSYGSWELVTAPTTSNKGSLKKTCSRCSDEVTFELPVLNSTDYTYSVTTAATCTQTGVGKYSYTKDTQTFDFEVTLEALGHDYNEGIIVFDEIGDAYITYTCKRNDVKDSFKIDIDKELVSTRVELIESTDSYNLYNVTLDNGETIIAREILSSINENKNNLYLVMILLSITIIEQIILIVQYKHKEEK